MAYWREKEKKSEQRKKLVLGGIIAFVMIASTVGFAFNNSTDSAQTKVKYNDVTFYRSNTGWLTSIENSRFVFGYLPQELENISMSNYIIPQKVYLVNDIEGVTIDIENSLGRIARILQYKGIQLQRGCIDPVCDLDVPVVECSDEKNKLYIKQGNETRIYQEDNCLIIESENNKELGKVTEKLIYFLLGII